MEVSAKKGKDGEAIAVDFNFGDDLKAMSGLFGDDVVFANARANMIVGLQSVIRAGIEAGNSKAQIQKAANEWKPGVKKRGKPKSEKLRDEFEKLSAEEKAALLAKLTG